MSTINPEAPYGPRNRLLDDAIFWFALVGIPGVILSIGRVLAIGWRPLMLVHILSLALLWTLWLARRRIGYKGRVLGLLAINWLVTFAGLAQLGPVALNGLFVVLFSFIAVLFLERKLAWQLIAGNAVCLVLLGVAASKGVFSFDIDYQTYSHHPLTWAHATWTLFAYGTVLALIGRRMMLELADSEARMRLQAARMTKLVVDVPGVIYQFLLHPDGRMEFPYISVSSERILGLSAEYLMQDVEHVFAMVHPDDARRVKEAIEVSARELAPIHQTSRIMHPTRGVVWVERHSTPERLANGDIRWHGFMRDITPLKAAEEQLAATLENAPNLAVQWFDDDGRVLYWNRSSEALYGWKKTETEGRRIDELIVAPVQVELLLRHLRQVAESGRPVGPVQRQLRHRDGSPRTVASTIFQLPATDSPVFVCMDVDVTSQKQAEEELVNARDMAESASRAKSAFLAGMSHELRTPLNAIMGFAQLLSLGMPEPLDPAQEEAVGYILSSSRQLQELINEVLDLARIEAGRIDLNLESLPLLPLIEEVMALSQPSATVRNVVLQRSCVENARAVGDLARTRQVLLNLASNAIKYNRFGGSVTFVCSVSGGYARVTVADTGLGISEAQRPLVFQPFQRLGAEQTTIDGTGIGLVVSKRLIEVMDGRIGFDSAFGVGSRFWFELPLDRRSKDRSESVQEEPVVLDMEAAARVQGRVIYIEDNPVNAKVMQHIFRVLPNVELTLAESAEEGLVLIRHRPPDLVLMDISLPGLSGYEALARLKADPATTAVPVIAVTASAMVQDVAHGLEAGFHDYLTKPFNVPAFLNQVRSILEAGKSSSDDSAGQRLPVDGVGGDG